MTSRFVGHAGGIKRSQALPARLEFVDFSQTLLWLRWRTALSNDLTSAVALQVTLLCISLGLHLKAHFLLDGPKQALHNGKCYCTGLCSP